MALGPSRSRRATADARPTAKGRYDSTADFLRRPGMLFVLGCSWPTLLVASYMLSYIVISGDSLLATTLCSPQNSGDQGPSRARAAPHERCNLGKGLKGTVPFFLVFWRTRSWFLLFINVCSLQAPLHCAGSLGRCGLERLGARAVRAGPLSSSFLFFKCFSVTVFDRLSSRVRAVLG